MKQFKLTVKSDDEALVKKIMHHLRKDFELIDEADECNRTLGDYLIDINRDIRDLALLVNGNDWPSTVNVLKGLKLVGSEYGGVNDYTCPECGHPDYYYTGGMMLCPQCEFSERAEAPFADGDITDFSGFLTLDRNQIR